MDFSEMLSFDFKEFVTSPAGILIILGIICLLVGIVMFLKEGKKAKTVSGEVKKEPVKVEEKPAEPAPTPAVEPVVPAPVVEPVAPAPAVEPVKVEGPVVVESTNDGVAEVPVPALTETLNISEPAAPAPVVEPVAPTPVVEEVKPEPVAPAPAVESLDAAQSAVYGGASPEVKVEPVVEQPKEIYGGASPLENTSPVPVAAVNTAAYGGANPQETITQVVENPVPVVETSAPVVAETPVAPAAPAVEPAKEEVEKLEF